MRLFCESYPVADVRRRSRGFERSPRASLSGATRYPVTLLLPPKSPDFRFSQRQSICNQALALHSYEPVTTNGVRVGAPVATHASVSTADFTCAEELQDTLTRHISTAHPAHAFILELHFFFLLANKTFLETSIYIRFIVSTCFIVQHMA